MSLDSELQSMQRNIPECVATGFVDMKTGMLLGVKTVDSHPQEVLDLVAAATGDLFQGQNVSAIENMFKKGRGVAANNHHYFQEVIVLSDNLLHVFQRCKKNEDLVVVAVCRVSANLGMVLTRSRMHLEKVETAAG
jgi:ethanolamine utilization protein EutA (predicted chaperonin)